MCILNQGLTFQELQQNVAHLLATLPPEQQRSIIDQQIQNLPITEQNKLIIKNSLASYNLEKNFNSQQSAHYTILYNEFLASYTSHDTNKGRCLEKLVRFIFSSCIFFKPISNVHTSTNEIDVLVELSDIGKQFEQFIDLKGRYLLAECKNYGTQTDKKHPVSVTWIGKFCSLLLFQTNARIGILFSHDGFAGKGNWHAAKGLARKFHYYKEHDNEKLYILDFNKDDFKRINDGECFLDILHEKVKDLECDTNIQQHLSTHPAELDNFH